MKISNNVFSIFLLLFVILKIVDLSNPSWIDIIIIVLFLVNTILTIITERKR
nr:MAG TPA: hypothetical protein [Caudoviricetes sp.]